ncbi:NAD(P)-binding protein [Annulohypoxylon truncatum]|uniref:NAD(P)-binding protein n=1 Tax=Annulohypoxylon truncatum TaxID=327061 RepID=UPI002007D4C2|nr:NAD(P)-binding protein [Annulohypoxylon truncatum]KAI1212703.1 NAD(P)-binding protein [Annulohypoxylon truncatum]
MSKPWILVSPASRGIGHALTRHLLRTTTAPILATARTDLPGVRSSILNSLSTTSSEEKDAVSKRLHLTHLDVTSEPSLASASAEARRLFPAETHHLRLAFALPGVLRPEKSPADVDYDAALRTLRVNVLGPLMLMKWFGDFLPRKSVEVSLDPLFTSALPTTSESESEDRGGEEGGGKGKASPHATFLLASARVGSTSDNRLGGWYTYRASKSAVISLARTYDLFLRNRSGDKAVSIAYHPGTVRTDLSREYWDRVRPEKLFTPEYAAERMVEIVRTRRVAEHRGRCWDWRGEEVLP